MEHGLVMAIGKGAKQTALLGIGIAQHRQRLIRVRCHHHVIEPLPTAPGVNLDAIGQAPHLPHRRGQPHPLDERRAEDRKSTRLNSSHSQISHAVFCLKKKEGSISAGAAVCDPAAIMLLLPESSITLKLSDFFLAAPRPLKTSFSPPTGPPRM